MHAVSAGVGMAKKEDLEVKLNATGVTEAQQEIERAGEEIIKEFEKENIQGLRSAIGSGTRSYILK